MPEFEGIKVHLVNTNDEEVICNFDQVNLLLNLGWTYKDRKVRVLSSWPREALRHLLDELKISYSHNASKAELLALIPGTHHEQIMSTVPARNWRIPRIVEWIESKGTKVNHAWLDEPDPQRKLDNLMEIVHDIVKLEAGILQ